MPFDRCRLTTENERRVQERGQNKATSGQVTKCFAAFLFPSFFLFLLFFFIFTVFVRLSLYLYRSSFFSFVSTSLFISYLCIFFFPLLFLFRLLSLSVSFPFSLFHSFYPSSLPAGQVSSETEVRVTIMSAALN